MRVRTEKRFSRAGRGPRCLVLASGCCQRHREGPVLQACEPSRRSLQQREGPLEQLREPLPSRARLARIPGQRPAVGSGDSRVCGPGRVSRPGALAGCWLVQGGPGG